MPAKPGVSKLIARRAAAEHRNEYAVDAAGRPRQEKKKRNPPVKTPEDVAREVEARKRSRVQKTIAVEGARDAIDEEVDKLNATFPGHSRQYFEREVLQTSILKKQRKTSAYNAYLRAELKKLNDALPAGAKKYTPSSPEAAPITAAWNTMTDEEKAAAAAMPLADLVETKETVNTAKHNTAIAAFHDVLDTLKLIHEELRRLNIRTGAEIALVVVRSQHDHFPAPSTFTTSPRVDEFFNLAYKAGLDEFAWRLEAYCLSGVHGVLKRREDALQELQSRTAAIIAQKFAEITKWQAKKMYYKGFKEKITRRFGVVIMNWPLSQFCAPSTIKSTTELELLYNSWSTGCTSFRKLTAAENSAWLERNPKGASPNGEDGEDEEDGGASTATRPMVNAVGASGGGAVTMSESMPRKRRSDYQGTHASKRRHTEVAEPSPAQPRSPDDPLLSPCSTPSTLADPLLASHGGASSAPANLPPPGMALPPNADSPPSGEFPSTRWVQDGQTSRSLATPAPLLHPPMSSPPVMESAAAHTRPAATYAPAPPSGSRAPTPAHFPNMPTSRAPTPAGYPPMHASRAPTPAGYPPMHASRAPTPAGYPPMHSSRAPTPAGYPPLHASRAPTPASVTDASTSGVSTPAEYAATVAHTPNPAYMHALGGAHGFAVAPPAGTSHAPTPTYPPQYVNPATVMPPPIYPMAAPRPPLPNMHPQSPSPQQLNMYQSPPAQASLTAMFTRRNNYASGSSARTWWG